MNKTVRYMLVVGACIASAYLTPLYAQTASVVTCPTQPKSQKGVNHIFFSFFKKSASLSSYIPANLVLVDPQYLEAGPRCMTAQSYSAFVAMNNALVQDMQKSLVISSAWRSIQTQRYFARERAGFAALPGRSEHHLGTTIDINIKGAKEEEYFGDSAVYQWMLVHAQDYGFVQSFNAEGEEKTGIPNEPWHWRFVGSTIATKIVTEKLDINAYLYLRAQLKKKLSQ